MKSIGSISTNPMAMVAKPGAIKKNETIATHQRCHFCNEEIKYPENATPRDAIPNIAPISVTVNNHQVKPSAISNKAGE